MNGVKNSDSFSQEKQEFLQYFPEIVKLLTEDDLDHPDIGDVITCLKEILEYSTLGGKYNRGITVVAAYRELVGPKKHDAKNIERALTVGWCVELFQTFFLMMDDIMDSSITRQGKLCWYKKLGIGLDAVNDSLKVEACIYHLLKLCCWDQPYYLNLIEFFLEMSYVTAVGQTLDIMTAPQDSMDLGRFTEKRHKDITLHKPAFYSFYLPVAAAMYTAGIDDKKTHDNAKKILLEMGEFFQIQDDYLDFFGDPNVTDKIGTDIEDNKCSWLVVQCMQQASPEQRQILKENYGQKDPEKVAKVKALYEEMDLRGVFTRYEESYNRLVSLVEKNAKPLLPSIFLGLAQKIYKHRK
ncbi:farnesyl pyrophosphate synthase-like [Suncus etruscus]|uniref:farnesyl pyrophosphate synthase-like n=1 Tax=Suncus etruscus TaxID=109475 RepID=UPI00210FBEDB|nr:farnesyl pyrophosphate synthase-like [Suncus etruscus]